MYAIRKTLSLLLLLGLVACGQEFDDLKSWMKDADLQVKRKVDPLPEVTPYQPYVYNAFDLVDPFNKSKMEVSKKAGGAMQPNLNRPRETLESYDLEKLRMVGSVQRGSVISGLISTPDSKLFLVKMGSYLGQNFGMITKVTETEITLKEIIEDSGGDWVERESTLILNETESK